MIRVEEAAIDRLRHRTVRETMHRYDDDDDEQEYVPLQPARPFRRLRTLGRGIAAAALIAILSLFASEAMLRRPTADITVAAEAPSTTASVRPVTNGAVGPRFRLEPADALDPPRSESARFDPSTGRRDEILTEGEFDAIEAPFLRVHLSDGSDSNPSATLFVTLARRAADGLGLSVSRTGERGQVDTKFGTVETLEATLTGEGRRICTAFTSTAPSSIHLDGWLCAPLGQPPEPRAVVCALDRVLTAGDADPTTAVAFREFDSRRDPGCRPAPPVASARETSGETGSIARPGRSRKNEAKLRQTTQARP